MRKKLQISAAAIFAAVSLFGADTLLDAARSGDINSQLQLAGEYFYGRQRQKNLTLALYWFRKAAGAGNPQAQYNLALCLQNGWGGKPNPAAAFFWYEKAMNNGVDKAAVRYAELLFIGLESDSYENRTLPAVPADHAKALDILREHAKKSDPDALLLLARYLFMDAPVHGRELRMLLEKYIENTATPDPEALVIYAACLRSGLGGMIPDPAKGAEVLRRAALMKHPEATAQLAEMLFYGFGGTLDRKQAIALYEEAIRLGSSRAMNDYAQLQLFGMYLPQNSESAFKLLTQAAGKNYPPAMRNLGNCYLSGIGTNQDIPKAFELFTRAADAGDGVAAYKLGRMYRNGEYTAKNLEMAFQYFHRSAVAGHPAGLREAGKALFNGTGVKADQSRAMDFLRRAAAAGDAEAAALLR